MQQLHELTATVMNEEEQEKIRASTFFERKSVK